MSSDESYVILELWENKNVKCSKGVREDVKLSEKVFLTQRYRTARKNLNRCIKGRLDTVLSVLDSCSLVQEALCACSEGKKGEAVSMGLLLFELETAKAQETLTDKYLAPLSLKYLSVALDTMSTNASSVFYSSPVSSQSTRLFHVFIKATVFWADIWVSRFGLHSLSADSLLTEGLKAVQNTSNSLVLKNCCKQSCVLVHGKILKKFRGKKKSVTEFIFNLAYWWRICALMIADSLARWIC